METLHLHPCHCELGCYSQVIISWSCLSVNRRSDMIIFNTDDGCLYVTEGLLWSSAMLQGMWWCSQLDSSKLKATCNHRCSGKAEFPCAKSDGQTVMVPSMASAFSGRTLVGVLLLVVWSSQELLKVLQCYWFCSLTVSSGRQYTSKVCYFCFIEDGSCALIDASLLEGFKHGLCKYGGMLTSSCHQEPNNLWLQILKRSPHGLHQLMETPQLTSHDPSLKRQSLNSRRF